MFGLSVSSLSGRSPKLLWLWDRLPADKKKSLRLSRSGTRDTIIEEWDVEKAVQGRYLDNLDALKDFDASGGGDPLDIVQKLRPVLESSCRSGLPGLFGPKDTLGEMVSSIRNAGPSCHYHLFLDDLDQVNLYSRRYHHGESAASVAEPIDREELRSFVKMTPRFLAIH